MKPFARTLTMLALAAALSTALAGCGGDGETDLAEGDATGEVLPGSASDAMIALDQLRSQAAADPEGTSLSATDDSGAASASDGATGDPDAVPAAPGPPPPAPATGGAPSPAATATARPSPPKAPAKTPAKAPASSPPKSPPKATSSAAPPPVSVLPTKTPSED